MSEKVNSSDVARIIRALEYSLYFHRKPGARKFECMEGFTRQREGVTQNEVYGKCILTCTRFFFSSFKPLWAELLERNVLPKQHKANLK